jgi:4-amino-4-deoxy-L-arabinose transferase-like glycosyltransferase
LGGAPVFLRVTTPRVSLRESPLVWLAALCLITALVTPALTAERGRLTSDESLYVSEALNIASGRGAVYTTGEPVVHRAPRFPALLALDFELAGRSLDAATWPSRIATVLNAFLTGMLARRLAGSVAGLVSGVVVASSGYFNGLGASIFLDQVQCTFVLASLLLIAHAGGRRGIGLHFGAGLLLGLAVLIKESAIQLAPLPLAIALLAGAQPGWRRALAAWAGGLGTATAGWWVWVFAQAGSVYLLGDPTSTSVKTVLAGFGAAAWYFCGWSCSVPVSGRGRVGHRRSASCSS